MRRGVPNRELAYLTGDAIDRHERRPDRDVEIQGDDHVEHRRGQHQAGRNEPKMTATSGTTALPIGGRERVHLSWL